MKHALLKVKAHPGWTGCFMREQAVGAILNGTRIVKTAPEPGDAHAVGAPGNVLGSWDTPPDMPLFQHIKFGYFVEWDDAPKTACAIMDFKIKPA